MKETYDGRGGQERAAGTIRSRGCSFCFKSQHEIRKLIAGPAAVYICDECVELCNEVVARGAPRSSCKTATSEELPTECLLERVQPIEDTIQGRGNQLQQVVDILQSREVSWARIGAALGIPRQICVGAVQLSSFRCACIVDNYAVAIPAGRDL
jgi:hypothetical protein